MSIFNKKQSKFYTLFDEVADNICKASALFQKAIEEKDAATQKAYYREMEKTEHDNDMLSHHLFIELGKNFITPFDREDIHYLASTLDDIIDYYWGIYKQVINYNITETGLATRQVSEKLVITSNKLRTAIMALKNTRELNTLARLCVELRKKIHESEKIIEQAIVSLYNGGKTLTDRNEVIEVIKMNDHYEMMLTLLQKYNTAVHVLDAVLIKYA